MDLDLKRSQMFAFNISRKRKRKHFEAFYQPCSKRLCRLKESHYILNSLDILLGQKTVFEGEIGSHESSLCEINIDQ